jgi:hypothetical protein
MTEKQRNSSTRPAAHEEPSGIVLSMNSLNNGTVRTSTGRKRVLEWVHMYLFITVCTRN